MKMCLKDPTALFSLKQTGDPLKVDCALLHRGHSIVEMSKERVVIGDTHSHQLLRVDDEDVSGIEHNQVLNLSDDGERWEGDVLNDQPYGWGVLYDSENRKIYKGFRIGDVNVCYGIQYYSDIQKVEYEGELCEGNRMGAGVLYNRDEVVIHNGEWVNNRPLLTRVELTDKNPVLHNRVEELIVKDHSCNGKEWSRFDLSIMPDLRLLQVGDYCFENVKGVKFNGLNELERVVIGENSFTEYKDDWPGSMVPNRYFYLKNCERLRELKMGRYSFNEYSVCEIDNVPSLEVIEMGDVNEVSVNFLYASLGLKSDYERMK